MQLETMCWEDGFSFLDGFPLYVIAGSAGRDLHKFSLVGCVWMYSRSRRSEIRKKFMVSWSGTFWDALEIGDHIRWDTEFLIFPLNIIIGDQFRWWFGGELHIIVSSKVWFLMFEAPRKQKRTVNHPFCRNIQTICNFGYIQTQHYGFGSLSLIRLIRFHLLSQYSFIRVSEGRYFWFNQE